MTQNKQNGNNELKNKISNEKKKQKPAKKLMELMKINNEVVKKKNQLG